MTDGLDRLGAPPTATPREGEPVKTADVLAVVIVFALATLVVAYVGALVVHVLWLVARAGWGLVG